MIFRRMLPISDDEAFNLGHSAMMDSMFTQTEWAQKNLDMVLEQATQKGSCINDELFDPLRMLYQWSGEAAVAAAPLKMLDSVGAAKITLVSYLLGALAFEKVPPGLDIREFHAMMISGLMRLRDRHVAALDEEGSKQLVIRVGRQVYESKAKEAQDGEKL